MRSLSKAYTQRYNNQALQSLAATLRRIVTKENSLLKASSIKKADEAFIVSYNSGLMTLEVFEDSFLLRTREAVAAFENTSGEIKKFIMMIKDIVL